ncbi:MAG TPA: shikimate kinase [Thermodesulfobacteriota bacterium]|nr:shikimate kinase [Thermodesulfobacteriota bacterium]
MEKKNNIYLIGFMGAGKTTVGRILSSNIGAVLVDMDLEIEKQQGVAISQIFEEQGEPYFRAIETEMLRDISQRSGQVVSTGGGIVIKDENWDIMKESGVTVYLKASIETLFNRVKHKTTRPLLNVDDPYTKAKELFESRRELYEKSDIILDREGLEPEEVAEAIVKEIEA